MAKKRFWHSKVTVGETVNLKMKLAIAKQWVNKTDDFVITVTVSSYITSAMKKS